MNFSKQNGSTHHANEKSQLNVPFVKIVFAKAISKEVMKLKSVTCNSCEIDFQENHIKSDTETGKYVDEPMNRNHFQIACKLLISVTFLIKEK